MFAEWLPVAKSAKCCASSWARNYTIYTVCGFCCPLENNELMREFSQETGAQFCRRKKRPKNSGGLRVNCLGKSQILFSEDLVTGKVSDNYTKMPVLISSSHDLYETRARNWRPHQKTISLMTTFEARRKLSNHFYPQSECMNWGFEKG